MTEPVKAEERVTLYMMQGMLKELDAEVKALGVTQRALANARRADTIERLTKDRESRERLIAGLRARIIQGTRNYW